MNVLNVLWTILTILSAAVGSASAPKPMAVEPVVQEVKIDCTDYIAKTTSTLKQLEVSAGNGKKTMVDMADFTPSEPIVIHQGESFSVGRSEIAEPRFVISSDAPFEIHQFYLSSGGGEHLYRSDEFINGKTKANFRKLSHDDIIMSTLLVSVASEPIEVVIWPEDVVPEETTTLQVEVTVCK